MLNDFEQITLERTLTIDELQRYIFRLVEDMNFRIRAVEDTAENNDLSSIIGSLSEVVSGKDGQDGRDGRDGVTYYTWIKYSPNADGSNMTNLPQSDTKYIGISYNNLSATESSNPSDYTWSNYVGTNGEKAYVHIAWANSADGTADFSTTISAGKQYIGVYSDNTVTGSSSPSAYKWSKIKGEKGDTGAQGGQGAKGDTGAQGVSVVSINNQYVYSDSPTVLPASPAWSTDVPSYDPTKYLWIRQVITYSNGSTTYTTPIHDAEMDDAIQRLSSAEEDIRETTLTIGGINVTIEGNTQDIDDLGERLSGAEGALGSLSNNMTGLTSDLSGLSITVNGIEISLDDLSAKILELRELNSQLTKDIGEKTRELNELIESFNNYVAEQKQWWYHDEDQGLVLGAEGSDFKTIIDNQRIAFMDGNTVTAYVSGQLFNMNNAVVRGTLRKGGYEEQTRTDGSIYIVWIGV